MSATLVGVFVYLIGLCVGSFLNVVVYRMPLGLSISQPRWSFCPSCRTTLRWYDNIPVLGWLLLGARCRYCRRPISAQYPLVEAATGLAFVLTYHLLMTAEARVVSFDETGATMLATSIQRDAPLLLAWLVLVACLIACASMDLIAYVIDTRITDVALGAGVVLCALWPRPEFFMKGAVSPMTAAATAAFVVSAVLLWRHARREDAEHDDESGEEHVDSGEATGDRQKAPSSYAAIAVAIFIFVGVSAWLLATPMLPGEVSASSARLAVVAAFAILFVAMVLLGGQQRDVDDELEAVIDAEAPGARRVAAGEVLWLLPALAAAAVVFLLVRYVPAIGGVWESIVSWNPAGEFTPLGGAAFAMHGAIIAATAGWIIRIVFTVALGREAFGVGDIYILGAAGAIAGWDIALLGFLLSVFVALAGWILGLLLKRPSMIPFGPPLAIGFLLALWLNQPAARIAHSYYVDLATSWNNQPRVVLIAGGLLLVCFPVAIFIARLTRRALEPTD